MSLPLTLADHIAKGERSQIQRENIECAYRYVTEQLNHKRQEQELIRDEIKMYEQHKKALEDDFVELQK